MAARRPHTIHSTFAATLVASLFVSACDSRRPTDGFSPAASEVASESATAGSANAATGSHSPANAATPAPHSDIVDATELPDDFELMFNHDGTCARCIDYRVHIRAKGRATYRNTAAEIQHPQAGIVPLPAIEAKRDIDPDIVLNMAREMGKIGFLDIDSDKLEEECEVVGGHRPLVTLKLTWNGRSNILKHDHRCDPEKLGDIRDALLSVERTIRLQTRLGDHLTKIRENAAKKYMPPEP